jgi:hypothetical protein
MKINEGLKNIFKSILNKYHDSLENPPLLDEQDFITRTVARFQQLKLSVGSQRLQTHAKHIDQPQKIQVYPYGPLFPNTYTTVELCGFLFIHKHILKGDIDSYRAALIQIAFTKSTEKKWSINTDQFSFLTQWSRFKITPTFPKWYFLQPQKLTWASYGFVGPQISKYPFYYSSKRMHKYIRKIPTTRSFTFPVNTRIGWDSSTSYLHKFVQGLVGENLLTNEPIKSFVEDFSSLGNVKTKPQREHRKMIAINEQKGFGVIEFTVMSGK